MLPDDLPRSPSGRVPQWVIDEAAGTQVEPAAWRTYSPALVPQPARRPRRTTGIGIILVVVLGGAWWLTSPDLHEAGPFPPALPPTTGMGPGAPERVPAQAPGTPVPAPGAVPTAPAPSAEAVALSDAAQMSDEGRQIFYGTRPQILGENEFLGRCGHTAVAGERGNGGALGCYNGATDTIVVYEPADPRLRGQVVATAAHEMLHAAWARLSPGEQSELSPVLEAEVASVPADDAIHDQIAGSVGSRPENRPTELFAYVGTQVWRDGGLTPQLEATYARFIADRPALVAVHDTQANLLDRMSADVRTAFESCAAREATNARDRLQLEADSASLAYYQQAHRARAAEVAAMPDDQRQALRLSWIWWDGTDLPMAPADQTLAEAARLLARDATNLAARDAAIRAAEERAAAERARADALVADLQTLQGQVVPGPHA